MFQQRKPHAVPAMSASQNENQAKEKLATFVYEYLVHAGASKTAEMFKSEMLSQQNIGPLEPHSGPGFLQDWFCVFWDLYCAAPERRDKFEPSQEAKAFHEYGFIPQSAYPGPMMNGMHGPPQFGNGAPGGMGMPPNGEGPQRYGPQGTRSGAPTPSSIMGGNGREFGNFPPGAPPPHMFNEQQMRNMQAAAAAAGQRMPPNARIPTVLSIVI
ncbi:single-stranded DNA-binding protein 3 [Ditylenchus destructor]|nr:single-stranded DNA-binding protein 3 [Ditylenchus destructor]